MAFSGFHRSRHSPARSQRRQVLRAVSAMAVAPLLPATASAAIGGLPSAEHDASSPEWERLRGQLFAGQRLVQGQSVVQLSVPLRAVPMAVRHAAMMTASVISGSSWKWW